MNHEHKDIQPEKERQRERDRNKTRDEVRVSHRGGVSQKSGPSATRQSSAAREQTRHPTRRFARRTPLYIVGRVNCVSMRLSLFQENIHQLESNGTNNASVNNVLMLKCKLI